MYKVEDHRYGFTNYTMKMGKIYIKTILQCVNYRAKHQAIAFKYQARLKVQAEA